MAQIDQRPNYCDFMTEIRYAKCGNKFLLQIEELIDWRPINAYLNRKYTKTQNAVGHPAYPAPLMFKILLLGIWYGLNDEALEERINDAISFSRFLGISMDKKAPDHSTISRFRSTLVKLEIMEKLLDLFNKQLKKKHLLTVKGVIVDASIVESPNTPSIIPDYEVADDRSDDCSSEEKEKEEKAHQKYKLDNDGDSEARWVKKKDEYYYGYKKHVATDLNGLVISIHTTPANVSDITEFKPLMEKTEVPRQVKVYADKGYPSAANRAVLKEKKLKDGIMRKKPKGSPISEIERLRNKLISKSRWVIERTFGCIQKWFGGRRCRYLGLAKTHFQNVFESLAYNLYRVPGLVIAQRAK